MYENYLIYGRILGTGVYSSLTYKVLEYDVSTSTFETFEDTYQLQETGPLVFSYIIDNRLYFQCGIKNYPIHLG